MRNALRIGGLALSESATRSSVREADAAVELQRASRVGSRRGRVEGFTLLELLLVVVIIGLLAAIVAPRLIGRSEEAKIGATKAQIKSLQNALQMFETDNGKLPTEEQGLRALVEKPVAPPEPKKWKKYLDATKVPKDPWDNEYVYRNPGERDVDGYDLYSFGPDGQEGTDDDIHKP